MIIIETRNIYHIIYFWLNAVRRVNMTQDGDKVHWGNKLIVGSTLSDCWDECIKTSKYMEKREAINKFNKTVKSHKHQVQGLHKTHFLIITLRKFSQAGRCLLFQNMCNDFPFYFSKYLWHLPRNDLQGRCRLADLLGLKKVAHKEPVL